MWSFLFSWSLFFIVSVFGKLVALKGIAPLSFSPEPLGFQWLSRRDYHRACYWRGRGECFTF